MNGRKAKRVRRMMSQLRGNPPADWVANLVSDEAEFIKKRSEPIGAGMCRRWSPPFVNPTRRLKRLARRVVERSAA